MRRVLVINGPNLNLLGRRRPDLYGDTSLGALERLVERWGEELGVAVETFHTNHEGAIIDRLHDAHGDADGVILNAGAFTHYSYAIHDAIEAIDVPVVEVHISNIKEREPWRRTSVIEAAAAASIYGRGTDGYRWALRHLVARAAWPVETVRYGDHPDQIADLRLPEGPAPHPVAVVIHGGFWRHMWTRDVMDPVAVDLTGRGWATWNVEYRRVGAGGGWPVTFEDVAAAIDALAGLAVSRRLDLERLTVLGHSAGGHLAAWAAGRSRLPHDAPGAPVAVPVRRAVSLAGVVDLTVAHRLGLGNGSVEALMRRPPDDARYDAADPARLLPSGVPTVLVHGAEDDVVPRDVAESFVAAAAAVGQEAELVTIPEVGHLDLIEPTSAAWPAVAGVSTAG